MRALTPEALLALSGSRAHERVVASAWYDGELIHPDLPMSSWQVGWERTRQVQAQGQAVVQDGDGSLSPWAVDDPLGVGGPRLRLTYLMSSGDEIGLGEYRVTTSDVSQTWRSQRLVRAFDEDGVPVITEEPPVWWSSGSVQVDADDLTWCVLKAEFLGPETVGMPGSVVGEVERLCDGIVPVEALDGVQDASVPSTITYEGTRLDAIGALLNSIEAECRMSDEGVLEILPSAPGPVVWDIAPGEEGVLVNFGRAYSAEDLVNTVVVEGKGSDDTPLIGVDRETDGPLRVNGPHGLMPAFRRSDILATQARVNAAARTYRRDIAASRSIVLPVTCLPHPGLQVADVVRLVTPVGDLVGPVSSLRLSGSAGGVAPMELGMVVALDDVQNIGQALRSA